MDEADGDAGAAGAAATPSRVVYTAVLGGYEALTEQPVAARSQVRFVCLTDDPDLRSETWDVRVVDPAWPLDHVRSARRLKILGHEALGDATETLWIDNRVVLTAPPETIFDAWLADVDLAMPAHSFRGDLLDEFGAVIDAGYDDPGRIYEQLWHYQRERPHVVATKPLWTAILARRRTPAVEATMAVWYEHVLRYSRRDQLSVLAALDETGISCGVHELDNYRSEIHEWLDHLAVSRRYLGNARAWRDAAAPPSARLQELEGRLDRLAVERAGAEAEIGQVRSELDEARRALQACEALSGERLRLAEERLQVAQDGLRAVEELKASTSWRVTAPLRLVGAVRRRLRARASAPSPARDEDELPW